MLHPRLLLRHPSALIVAMLAASDLAYRLLLRESLRRALGVERQLHAQPAPSRALSWRRRAW
jgi:hypothetical protein